MRRWIKIAAWIAVFAACAGVGAFIASRTNPFPPGVEDPGARSSPSTPVATSPPPAGNVVSMAASATTRHDLFVGGSCATDWTIRLRLRIGEAGAVTGRGIATLNGRLRCDFATAQTQARRIPLRVRGHRADGTLTLRIRALPPLPTGSDDYGGLVRTLTRFPILPLSGGLGAASVHVSDGNQGAYAARYRARVLRVTA